MAYGDMLIRAYEGEVAGQAFFATLARARDVWREKQELHFLATLEARTAAALEPLLRRDRLKARSHEDLEAEGIRDAERYSNLSWTDLNARFASDFAPYVDEFKATQLLAPANDAELLALVTGHEVALIAFAADEEAGRADSHRHLHKYIERLDAYLSRVGQAAVSDAERVR